MPAYKSKKSKNNTFVKPLIYLGLFLILSIGFYKIYPKIEYYLGFRKKSDRLTEKQRKLENKRIKAIVNRHEDNLFGVDISQYQGQINWEDFEAKEEMFEVKFVIARATMGERSKDKKFISYWENLSETPFFQGAYHYYRPDENSTAQAQNFIETVKLRKGQLPPVLDIEEMPESQSMSNLKKGLKNWCDLIEKHYKIKPIIYSSEKYYKDFLKEEFKGYHFWIANYNPWRESVSDDFLMWQFTDKAQMEGVNEMVDVNVFNGDLNQLKKICLQ